MNSNSTASDRSFSHASPMGARFTSFCSCGTADALRRLRTRAGADWPAQAPAWLTDATMGLHEATALASRMSSATRCAVCHALVTLSGGRLDDLKEHANATTSVSNELAAVTMRLLAGAALEGVARREDRRSCNEDSAACRQLWADSAHVAVWTSAHAECACAVAHNGFLMAEPCAAHLPCFLSEIDLSDLYARRADAHSSSKESTPLKHLLQRATSPGQRGWDSIMEQAFKNEGVASVVRDSVAVCLLGLHPQLPPRARAEWRTRQALMRLLQQTLYRNRGATALSKCPVAVKESLRRRIAAIMHASPAEHAALSMLQHPVRHLLTPPCALPSVGQQAAMKAFVHAGEALTRLKSVDSTESVALVINDSFKLRSEAHEGPPFDTSWLGKGTISVGPRIQLVSMASSAWSLAFRANFLPFWTFCMSHGIRATRLDAVQHESVHSLNSATRLCALLTEDRALHAQRVALRTPSAALLNVREAASLLGVGGTRTTTAARAVSARPTCVTEATELLRVEGGGTAEGAALLLAFARVASVTENVLTFALGEDVARRQARALLRRFLHPLASTLADEDVVRLASAELPKHAAHAHVCCECRRLATAHVGTESARTSEHPFNEIGVAATMMCRDTASACTELRCAKRSSAALRSTLASEAEMKQKTPERLEYDAESVVKVLTERNGAAAGASARIRRDAKSALEQTSVVVPCGTRPMLVLPLIGRAVRIFNEWVALCALCGGAMVVRPHHRYGGDIVCMRCDPGMLYSREEVSAAAVAVERRQRKICRFCGK